MKESPLPEPAREFVEAEHALAQALPYDRWSDALKAEHTQRTSERTTQVLRFQLYLGALVCTLTLFWDFLVLPAHFETALVWRLLTNAPLTILGLALLSRGQVVAAKAATGAAIISLAVLAMHLSAFGDEALMTRYCMAVVFLLGIACFALPFNPAELRKFALAFIVMTSLAAMWPNAVDPVAIGMHITFALLIGGTSIAIARNYWEIDAQGFLKDLREDATRVALEESNRMLRRLSERDPLTGSLNRRGFDRVVERLLVSVSAAETRTNPGTSIGRACAMMIDLDHFKRFNDTHGHQAGDTCLTMVAATLEEILKDAGGLVGRFGGEEFVVGFRERREGEAKALAERVRLAVADLLVPLDSMDSDAADPLVTASIGIGLSEPITGAISEESSPTLREELIEMADAALYAAKRAGRNRVEVVEAGGADPERDAAAKVA